VVVKVPMPAFMITVYQVRAYAVALFGGALLLLHVAVLIQRSRSAGEGSLRVLAQQSGTFHSSIDPCHNISRVRKASQAFLNTLNTLNIIANRPPHDLSSQVAFPLGQAAGGISTRVQGSSSSLFTPVRNESCSISCDRIWHK